MTGEAKWSVGRPAGTEPEKPLCKGRTPAEKVSSRPCLYFYIMICFLNERIFFKKFCLQSFHHFPVRLGVAYLCDCSKIRHGAI